MNITLTFLERIKRTLTTKINFPTSRKSKDPSLISLPRYIIRVALHPFTLLNKLIFLIRKEL
uniref:Uncharacterized protein n=1 Tax=Lepeophtheirus salmonis TaxID=72036 RepID=A0A0K2U4H8_LEPSM